MVLRVNKRGAAFTAGWEGFRSCPYRDAVGVPTIGYGTTSAVRPVSMSMECISKSTARRWLRRALNKLYLPHIPRRYRMKACEVAALTSFAYNLGPGAVSDTKRSTLARRLRGTEGRTYRGRKRIYREEMPKWINAGGRRLDGLVKRRAAEVRLAIHGDYSGRP